MDSRALWVALAGLTVAAFALRLAAIDQTLDGDELFTYANTVHRSLGHVVQADNENNPPLFYVLAWAAAKLGDPTIAIRLPSLVLGTALVPVVYALGVRTVGRPEGLLGAAVVAIDPFSAFYGIEARGYTTVMFAAALSTLSLLAALDTGRRRWWVLYVVGSVAVVYTHYLGVFVLLTQLAWALWVHREQVRALVLANGVVTVGCIPLVPAALGSRGSLLPDRPLTAASMFRELARLFVGHPGAPWDEVPGTVAAYAFYTLVAAAVGVAAVRAARAGSGRIRPRVALVVALGLSGRSLVTSGPPRRLRVAKPAT